MPTGVSFPTYEALTASLTDVAARHPHLVELASLGRTHRGREVWLLTVTDRRTGPPEAKPAVYMDGNIHAEELTAGAAVVHLLDRLIGGAVDDPDIQDLLQRRTFYLVPRANPDGADIVQTTPYPWVGNGRRLPPLVPERGLYYDDIDGDGLVLWMRRPDPDGEWKTSDRDARLMVPRGPGERGGVYYRLFPEGRISAYDGGAVLVSRPQDGNLNRHFPADWDPDEYGGGPLPLSEPESRAIAECLVARPNIGVAIACHTHGGVLLPPDPPSEVPFPFEDRELFTAINKLGEQTTGYPAISVLRDFTVPGMPRRHGVFNDWAYLHLGMLAYTVELWDVIAEAGIARQDRQPFHPLTEDQQIQLLRWNDQALGGDGFVPWRPFTHPELGAVEIGGWKYIQVFRNPPTTSLLEREVDKVARFVLELAAALPELRVSATVRMVGPDLYLIGAVVANGGYTPTSVTAVGARRVGSVTLDLEVADGMTLVMGSQHLTLPHLSGRSERPVPWNPWVRQWTPNAHRVEWLIRAPRGGTVAITAATARAGAQRLEVRLGAPD
ncbi:MAG: M14 family metallopeptidase [Armatimonadota bacterium]|nr:M14 family metallopeptidase [Armatimonadota bacterium]